MMTISVGKEISLNCLGREKKMGEYVRKMIVEIMVQSDMLMVVGSRFLRSHESDLMSYSCQYEEEKYHKKHP